MRFTRGPVAPASQRTSSGSNVLPSASVTGLPCCGPGRTPGMIEAIDVDEDVSHPKGTSEYAIRHMDRCFRQLPDATQLRSGRLTLLRAIQAANCCWIPAELLKANFAPPKRSSPRRPRSRRRRGSRCEYAQASARQRSWRETRRVSRSRRSIAQRRAPAR
jgi:hypothetical protein